MKIKILYLMPLAMLSVSCSTHYIGPKEEQNEWLQGVVPLSQDCESISGTYQVKSIPHPGNIKKDRYLSPPERVHTLMDLVDYEGIFQDELKGKKLSHISLSLKNMELTVKYYNKKKLIHSFTYLSESHKKYKPARYECTAGKLKLYTKNSIKIFLYKDKSGELIVNRRYADRFTFMFVDKTTYYNYWLRFKPVHR